MTTVYLACWHGSGMKQSFSHERTSDVPLLVSYVALKGFLKLKDSYYFAEWVLDSGAYSAHTRGIKIDLAEYTAVAKDLLQSDQQLTQVFALDVIGDWREGEKNTAFMWKHGVPATPCFHQGEPWDVLVGMARNYPRIALGGIVGVSAARKRAWVEECFARIWPCRVHGFGIAGASVCLAVPFTSVDATTWAYAATTKGEWRGMSPLGKRRVSLGSRKMYDLGSEIKPYTRLQRLLKHRWRKELSELSVDDNNKGAKKCVRSMVQLGDQIPR